MTEPSDRSPDLGSAGANRRHNAPSSGWQLRRRDGACRQKVSAASVTRPLWLGFGTGLPSGRDRHAGRRGTERPSVRLQAPVRVPRRPYVSSRPEAISMLALK